MNAATEAHGPVICLMGPTASGKTDLAIALVASLPLEIISVDSVMIYRDMDIGSAKPDRQTLELAPHRLIDFLDPAEAYSAARFRQDARLHIAEVRAAGRIPLLVGGTMLYYRALLDGLSRLPSADAETRQRLEAEAAEVGWQVMHQRLQVVDAEAAARIHPNDPQRIQRALEVYEVAGTPMSVLQRQGREQTCEMPDAIKLAVAPAERAVLHQRIAQRFEMMLQQGLVEEVQRLYQRADLDLSKPAMRAVGYRQVWEYLAGVMNYTDMQERGVIATRQLAKRQLTWLRAEPGVKHFDSLEKNLIPSVLKWVEQAIN